MNFSFRPEYHSVSTYEQSLMNAGLMNPNHRRVKERLLLEKPVRHLLHRFPAKAAEMLDRLGYKAPKRSNHMSYKDYKDFLGTLPKCVLEQIYFYLAKVES